MKLIQIDLSNYVIVAETTNSFKAGDFVLINCSEIGVKNEVKQVIEYENHLIGLPNEILVFAHDCLTNTTDAIHPTYCKKIIYSTTPLNGVKYIDINYIRSLFDYMKTKITLSGQDLVKIISEFKEKRPMSIHSYVGDYINSKTPDKNEWDVYFDNNYIKLKEDKQEDKNDYMKKIQLLDYMKVIELLDNICDWSSFKEHPIGKQAKEALEILTKD